ncbi:MAG: IMS domain-containing protein [Mastigocoleus sp. MO_167.B18]|nr:IMS domain-containing protein [Mastigocoleus sp. MO_167.B18]
MRIPLDYYRILGLPLAASEEQLRQAYSDRMVGLPRREYSQAAIDSRKQLIEEAYVVLSNPKDRKAYDRLYLSNSYYPDDTTDGTVAVEERLQDGVGDTEPQSLNIEIAEDELVGALLILQELGEYELVLKLGSPYITNNSVSQALDRQLTQDKPRFDPGERPDIVLTVALACLELGREEWQQGNHENAATSLETGRELLYRENMFPNIQAEIQSDLDRLCPYQILELLALPLEKKAERQQGLRLLEEVLEQRHGIDGDGDDRSGLNIDDFLRFIQQLRHYLTAAEQQKIFEAESRRPSAVATYLAVYALIARGFAQRQPALIRQGKKMLMSLGKRQDVHLEQSLCALLLGQTEEAIYALELSQEYEALAFIRENSQNSPDLLPGLCLYSERWLQNEVFAHFRDLVNQQVSLKDYFADSQVQAYLEALPVEREVRKEWKFNNQNSQHQNSQHQNSQHQNSQHQNSSHKTARANTSQSPNSRNVNYRQSQEINNSDRPRFSDHQNSKRQDYSYSSRKSLQTNNGNGNTHRTSVPTDTRERFSREVQSNSNISGSHLNGSQLNSSHLNSSNNTNSGATATSRRQRTRTNSRASDTHQGNIHQGNLQRPNSGYISVGIDRRIRLLLASVAGVALIFLLGSTAWGWMKNILSPPTAKPEEQLAIAINEPPIKIPNLNKTPESTTGKISKSSAETVIRNWLLAKTRALGQRHDIDSLKQALTGQSLSQWERIVRQEKAANRYRMFQHRLDSTSLKVTPIDEKNASVVASVTEAAKFYQNGQINNRKSYNETIRVKYDLVMVNNAWRIQEMSVLSTVSKND